jgi:hypothetical protein|tara:strand:- start:168 stop:614 length:447 start_codon:yes stop_codon:yes gene_type:complete
MVKMARAEVVGLTADLSGNIVPVKSVTVSDTVNKTIEVLDKIERVEKEKDKVYYNKITTIEPKKAADQYCYVKITIKETDNTITKEETLECADGRKKVDGPSYWELFAQFYYRDISTPEYCRVYSRPNHVFKSFGKTCLNKDGEWKVK